MCAPYAFSRLSQPTAMSICSAVHSRNNMRPFGRRTPTSKLWQAIAASWRMTVLRVIRLLLIWQYPHRHRGVKNQILVVPLVLPAPMLVVPFVLPLEPIWFVALLPLGRPPLPIGLVSLGS